MKKFGAQKKKAENLMRSRWHLAFLVWWAPAAAAQQPTAQPTTCGPLELKSAQFTNAADTVVLQYNTATDQAGYVLGEHFACDLVFEGLDGATCSFVTSTSVRALVSSSPQVLPRSAVSMLGVVRASCSGLTGQGKVSIAEPSSSVVPGVVLQAPERAPICEGVVEIDARQSTKLGGRPPSAVDFTIKDVQTDRVLYRNTTTTLTLDLSGETLLSIAEKSSRIEATLALTNFLGRTGIGSVYIELSSDEIPTVYILGSRTQQTTRSATIEIQSRGEATQCSNRSRVVRGVDYNFALTTIDGFNVFDGSTSRDPRVFKLPADELQIGDYVMTMTATDRATRAANNASVIVEVHPQEIEVVIDGGNRTISTSRIATLSADRSRDPDDPNAELSFRWRCSRTDEFTSCPRINATGATIRFAPGALAVGEYQFIVEAIANGKAAEAQATLDVRLDESRLTDVFVNPLSSYVWPTNARLILDATIASVKQTETATWYLDGGLFRDDATLEEAALTPTTKDLILYQQAASAHPFVAEGQATSSFQLALRPNSMLQGATYRFRLEAGGASAIVEVLATEQPSSGVLSVTPEIGFALATKFTLETSRWASDNLPLRYRFETRMASTNLPMKILRAASLDTRLEGAILSANKAALLAAVAIDNVGAAGDATTTVVVSEPDDATAFQLAFDEISTAFVHYEKEVIAQVAVTTSALIADRDVRDSLVGNLVEAWLLYDPVADQIASFASAFLSPIADPDLVGARAARSALEQTRDVALRHSEAEVDETLDDLATIDLTVIVSNLLASIIFNTTDVVDDDFTSRLDGRVDSISAINSSALVGETIDALARARLRERALDEAQEVFVSSNVRFSTRRVSGTEFVELDLAGDTDANDGATITHGSTLHSGVHDNLTAAHGRVVVPSLGMPTDITFAEYQINPYRVVVNGADVAGTVLRFDLGTEQNTRTDVEVALIVPVIEDGGESADTAANVSLVCDWNVLGNVTAVCPSTGQLVTYECQTRDYEEVTLGCGNRAERRCVDYDLGRRAWGDTLCVHSPSQSTDAEDYCICNVKTEESESTDFSTQALLSRYGRPYAEQFLRSSINVRRSIVMLVFLCVYVCFSSAAVLAIYLVGKRSEENEESENVGLRQVGETRSMKEETDGSELPCTSHNRSEVHCISLRNQLRAIMETDHVYHQTYHWWQRFVMVLSDKHQICRIWRKHCDCAGERAMGFAILSVEILFIFCAVALENQYMYPDPGCDERRSKDRCHHYKAAGGRKLCKWSQDDGSCDFRGPPSYSLYTIEHYVIVLIVTAILLPCIAAFEWASLDVLSGATIIYQDNSAAPETSRKHEAKQLEAGAGGAPTTVETCDGTTPNACEADINLGAAPLDTSVSAQKGCARHAQRGLIETHNGFKVLRALPPDPMSMIKPANVQFRRKRAIRSDKDLYREAQDLSPSVADALLARREELREAMRHAHGQKTPRGKRMAYLLFLLEQDLTRTWGIVPDRCVFEHNVSVIVWNQLRVARNWRIELAQMPEQEVELRALWIANKSRVLQLGAIERRVYEHVYGSQLSVATIQPKAPSRCTLAVACLVCVCAVVIPIVYLLSYATDVGRRLTLAFFVQALFANVLVFGIVLPLMLFLTNVLFPSLIVEKIERLASVPRDAMTRYPYKQPLKESALDYLLEDFPDIEEALAELSSPCQPLSLRRSRIDPLESSCLTLEQLEEIHNHISWKPLWTSASVLAAVAVYLWLPVSLQELAVEETALVIPMCAFGATQVLTERNDPNGLIIMTVAIVLTWCGVLFFASLCGEIHKRARLTRLSRLDVLQDTLVSSFPIGERFDQGNRAAGHLSADRGALIHCELPALVGNRREAESASRSTI